MDETIEIIKLIFQLLGTFGMGGIIAGIISRKLTKAENKRTEIAEQRERQEEEKAKLLECYSEAIKVLLREAIYRIGNDVEKKQYFTVRESADFDDAWNAYSALNGNHQTESYYNFVKNTFEIKNDD